MMGIIESLDRAAVESHAKIAPLQVARDEAWAHLRRRLWAAAACLVAGIFVAVATTELGILTAMLCVVQSWICASVFGFVTASEAWRVASADYAARVDMTTTIRSWAIREVTTKTRGADARPN